MASAEQTINPTNGPIHSWFSVDYTNYLVLHRTLLQSMPTEWQDRMVTCLNQLHEAFQHVPQPEGFTVEAATEHEVSDLTDAQKARLGITEDWYRGEKPPEGMDAQDLAEWQYKHENPEGSTYYRGGYELDPGERVMLPAEDPVPHYRHSYIEPKGLDQPAELTIYRASHESIAMGLYTSREVAREHCETRIRREWPLGTNLSFTWTPDDLDPLSAEELSVCAGQTDETVTGYVVTPLEVAAAYDEEADE